MLLAIRINLNEKVVSLSVEDSTSIAEIKNRIEATEGIQRKYQQLYFGEAELDDCATISDLGVESESIFHLNLSIDSGYEVWHKFIGLKTIPDVFEQIVDVKVLNEELFAQIKATTEVEKINYFAEYSVNEGGSAVIQIIGRVETVQAARIIADFKLDGTLAKVKDYFNDHIVYDVSNGEDLGRVNADMFVPVTKFVEVFAEGSDKMRAVMMEYAANYCTLYRNLIRLLKVELVDDVSRQSELDEHAAAITGELGRLRGKGVQFGVSSSSLFPNSAILLNPQFDSPMRQWLGEKGVRLSGQSRFVLLYRGSSHGSQAQIFHQRCDHKGRTVTLIRCTSGYIFGAYASDPWTSRSTYANNTSSFLFSLLNPAGSPPTKYDVTNGPHAQYDNGTYGPTFGGGHDLHIGNQWQGSYSSFPHSYGDSTRRGNNTFTGAKNFTPAEVEVWQVVE
jgi:hypothetical protein